MSTAWSSHGRQLFIQKVGNGSLYASYLAGSPVSKLFSAKYAGVNLLSKFISD